MRIRRAAALALAAISAAGPAGAADPIRGRQLYEQYCVSCHGPDGRGIVPGAPNFATGQTLFAPDNALLLVIRSGRNAMPGFRGLMNDNDIRSVISHVRTLR